MIKKTLTMGSESDSKSFLKKERFIYEAFTWQKYRSRKRKRKTERNMLHQDRVKKSTKTLKKPRPARETNTVGI